MEHAHMYVCIWYYACDAETDYLDVKLPRQIYKTYLIFTTRQKLVPSRFEELLD